MKKLILTLACSLSLIFASAGNYKVERDIAYRTSEDKFTQQQCRLDIAAEKGVKDAPVIVWFHSGGLVSGKKEAPQPLMRDGVVVVGVGYRLSPNATVNEIIDDAACAVAWVYENIEKYGGSREKIFLAGHSAGGYLVSMVGLDKSRLERYGIDANSLRGIVPFSGQVITHFTERDARGIRDTQPVVDSLAPLYHVRGDAAPMLLLVGDRELEMLGRYEENAYFWRMLRLSGHKDVEICEFDGYGHNMVHPGWPLLLEFVKRHK